MEERDLPQPSTGWMTTAPETGPPARPGTARRRAGRIIRLLALLLVGYYAACLFSLLLFRFVDPPTTGVQMQRRLEALLSGREYKARKTSVAYERMSPHLPRAVVVAEDGRFWSHWGFDFAEMRAAAAGTLQGQPPRGASTITQQLVKNLFGYTYRNPVRKLYDLGLTPPAELALSKQRILELYLNNVEWGDGVFGAEAAAQHHYGVSAGDLSRSQAAGLAALLPNPRRRTPENTSQYRAAILRRLSFRGW